MAEKQRIALALKYRPKAWSDVVGQDAIKTILSSELQTGNLKRCMLFTGPAGCGKCLGKDTPVMMYDKTIKKVQDIKIGELLMGDDGTSRTVLSLAHGRELMYEVILDDETSFKCNKSHIISLRNGFTQQILNVNIEEYFKHKEDYPEWFAYKYNDNGLYTFTVKQLDEDEYYGFEIDGNKLFVLGNGIVTHNTTSARIFAHEIESIKANTVEINCADNTGVDDVRRLLIEPSHIKPLAGTYKVFILDECHMLTTQAQNALLKLLEEPPLHCVYLLCTTDPQKVLPTIMSRAVRYDFQLIPHQLIIDRLNYILENEKNSPDGVDIESWDMTALDLLATSAQGHLRNSIVNLDKILAFTKNIRVEDVEKVLGVTSYNILFNILDCILTKDQNSLLVNIDNMVKSGMDLKLFVKNFLSFVLDVNKYVILKGENMQNPMSLLSLPKSFEDKLRGYNVGHREPLKKLLQVLLELNSSLRWETDIRPVLETNLLMEVL